jgi:glycosyltransferase involved in cell wall biosynthesis
VAEALPDLAYPRTVPRPAQLLRVLFFGRLQAYKGLDLCVEAVRRARARGAAIELTLAGEGALGPLRPALDEIGAIVVNRWLDDDTIGRLLGASDVVMATHRQASQSGVIAAAFGAGRPVLTTPVGALPEQVAHERTGLVAQDVTAQAVADALVRLNADRELLATLTANVCEEAPKRSMKAFVAALERASESARRSK